MLIKSSLLSLAVATSSFGCAVDTESETAETQAIAAPEVPPAKCIATCYLKTDVTYKLVSNTENAKGWGAEAMILHGGGVQLRSGVNDATRTGDNPTAHAELEQTSTLDPVIVCDYSKDCDNQNYGGCSVGTDEDYRFDINAEIKRWNTSPTKGTGSNNNTAKSEVKMGVANPLIPGSYADAKQTAETNGGENAQQAPPNVFDQLKVKCKLSFKADATKPVSFGCNVDFEPLEVLNALFWKPANPKVEPRAVDTSGAVPTVWTSPPVPPQFTAGVPASSSKPITNQRSGRLFLQTFAASHCKTGPCTWGQQRPQAYNQGYGRVGIKAAKIKKVLSVGSFDCVLKESTYNWWLPGIKQGPNGTPVFLGTSTQCGVDGCGDEVMDESLMQDLVDTFEDIPPVDRSYEEFIQQTQPTTNPPSPGPTLPTLP